MGRIGRCGKLADVNGRRRNVISRNDEIVVRFVALASALAAAFSGAEPTGNTAVDVAMLGIFAIFTTWCSASASWWALVSAAGLAVAGSIVGPLVVALAAVAAFVISALLAWDRRNRPVIRAAIGAVVVQVMLRLEWNPFFLASALLATVACGFIIVSGLLRRPSYVRRRVYWAAGGIGVFWLLAAGALGVSAAGARNDVREGYQGLLDGLELVQDGDTLEAASTLRTAAASMREASKAVDGPLTKPARLVPVVEQNRSAAADLISRVAASADAAADALEIVNLDQLTIENGVIDVAAFAQLEAPLAALEATIVDLDDALHDADSPWLVGPMQSRLDQALDRTRQALPQARATAAAARTAPAMLGADGERRYFLAFVNTAESRGMGGLMGNWSEITIDQGRLQVTASGRTNDLQSVELRTLALDAPAEYMARYGEYGADRGGGVDPKYWSNVTVTPDMPSVGNAMAQMYEVATGRSVDGVIVIDPAGLARLLDVTGPIQLEGVEGRIDGSNAERFLLLEQYEFVENEREDLLTAITDQTVANLLGGTLPPPQQLAAILADAALEGHISAWAGRPEEQDLLELVGMDASLPVITEEGIDALAVSSNNGSGNKIETFLERSIEYRSVVNERTGDVTATLRIELTNTAPTTGYTDYVIGNIMSLPMGTNRMVLDVHTLLGVTAARIDDREVGVVTLPELGYNAWNTVIEIPPGGTVTIELDLAGDIGSGQYRLVYRPQALPNPDTTLFEVETTDGDTLFTYDETIRRRTVLSADRIEAWR